MDFSTNRKLGLIAAAATVGAIVYWRRANAGGTADGGVRLKRDAVSELGRLSEAFNTGYASMVAAFESEGENHGALDDRAQRDVAAIADLVAGMRDSIPEAARELGKDIAEQFEAAQLKLMAFAINRKNRGVPDGAQIELENADLQAFKREAKIMLDRLTAAIESKRLSTVG